VSTPHLPHQRSLWLRAKPYEIPLTLRERDLAAELRQLTERAQQERREREARAGRER